MGPPRPERGPIGLLTLGALFCVTRLGIDALFGGYLMSIQSYPKRHLGALTVLALLAGADDEIAIETGVERDLPGGRFERLGDHGAGALAGRPVEVPVDALDGPRVTPDDERREVLLEPGADGCAETGLAPPDDERRLPPGHLRRR